jgi:hypothetical protein
MSVLLARRSPRRSTWPRSIFWLSTWLCACSSGATGADSDMAVAEPDLGSPADMAVGPDLGKPAMSFFITSRTGSGDLGGLTGADAICQNLATAVGAGGKTWRAYLSASGPAVHARDRIGTGPWYNFAGVKIADSVADLHSANVNINKATGLTETGMQVPGVGDTPNQHDILTGSDMNGMANGTNQCANWTSTSAAGSGTNGSVGHFDRQGGGTNPMSWNFAHNSNGCSAPALVATAGAGRFYCFASN